MTALRFLFLSSLIAAASAAGMHAHGALASVTASVRAPIPAAEARAVAESADDDEVAAAAAAAREKIRNGDKKSSLTKAGTENADAAKSEKAPALENKVPPVDDSAVQQAAADAHESGSAHARMPIEPDAGVRESAHFAADPQAETPAEEAPLQAPSPVEHTEGHGDPVVVEEHSDVASAENKGEEADRTATSEDRGSLAEAKIVSVSSSNALRSKSPSSTRTEAMPTVSRTPEAVATTQETKRKAKSPTRTALPSLSSSSSRMQASAAATATPEPPDEKLDPKPSTSRRVSPTNSAPLDSKGDLSTDVSNAATGGASPDATILPKPSRKVKPTKLRVSASQSPVAVPSPEPAPEDATKTAEDPELVTEPSSATASPSRTGVSEADLTTAPTAKAARPSQQSSPAPSKAVAAEDAPSATRTPTPSLSSSPSNSVSAPSSARSPAPISPSRVRASVSPVHEPPPVPTVPAPSAASAHEVEQPSFSPTAFPSIPVDDNGGVSEPHAGGGGVIGGGDGATSGDAQSGGGGGGGGLVRAPSSTRVAPRLGSASAASEAVIGTDEQTLAIVAVPLIALAIAAYIRGGPRRFVDSVLAAFPAPPPEDEAATAAVASAAAAASGAGAPARISPSGRTGLSRAAAADSTPPARRVSRDGDRWSSPKSSDDEGDDDGDGDEDARPARRSHMAIAAAVSAAPPVVRAGAAASTLSSGGSGGGLKLGSRAASATTDVAPVRSSAALAPTSATALASTRAADAWSPAPASGADGWAEEW